MKQEDIIRMAREAQMPFYWCTEGIPYLDKLERFAELVRAQEREACAKVADDMNAAVLAMLNVTRQPVAIAAAIRARSDT